LLEFFKIECSWFVLFWKYFDNWRIYNGIEYFVVKI